MPVAVDEQVPVFSSPSTDGEFELGKWKGKNLVLYFYPKDNTPGCTLEGENFRDLYPEFEKANTTIFGISRDSVKSHLKFKADKSFPFELISDPDESICTLFDVMKMKNMYGKQVRGIERSTFVIDSKGILVKQWRNLKVPGHAQEVLDFVRTIQD